MNNELPTEYWMSTPTPEGVHTWWVGGDEPTHEATKDCSCNPDIHDMPEWESSASHGQLQPAYVVFVHQARNDTKGHAGVDLTGGVKRSEVRNPEQ
jgi:hypothetical protein